MYPAFAKRCAQAARAGFAPSRGVIVVGDWDLYRAIKTELDSFELGGSWVCVAQPDHDARELEWTFCAGVPVWVYSRSMSRMDSIAAACHRAGASYVIGYLDGKAGFYRYGDD